MYIKLNGSRAGFTLTEIIVSALLVGLIAAGIFGAFVGAEKFIILTKHKMEAVNFARKAMETLRGRYSYSDLGPPAPDLGDILQGDLSSIGSLTYSVSEAPPDGQPDGYKKITVRVEWNEPRL